MEQFENSVREELEGFNVGEVVQLFTVDARAIGGSLYRFSPSPVEAADGSQIRPTFGGVEYAILPFASEGWDHTAAGQLPQPTVKFLIAREDGDQNSLASILLALVEQHNDFLGAKVVRIETLRKHLDDGADPNPHAHLGLDSYIINRKSNQTSSYIEFQLQAALDLEDVQLPKRQVLNHCQWSYRKPKAGGGFDYEHVTCPYVGSNFFDADGQAVTEPDRDRCGYQLRDCKLRFGANGKLPFGGFPGVGKFKTG